MNTIKTTIKYNVLVEPGFVTHSIEEAVYVSDQIAILLPRPSRVSEIIRPSNFRAKGVDAIRRDSEYLDIVDDIWTSLRSYVE